MSTMRWVRSTAAAFAVVVLSGAALSAPALLDATRRGDVEAVRTLLTDGADPNEALGDGLTALHVAAQEGRLEIARILIQAGADVAAKTRLGGYTPLHLASGAAHVALVRSLIEAGADPAAATTTTGVTPLHLGAKALHGEEVARVLLESGAPVDAREASAGQTPLIFAAAFGRAPSVRELLGRGADPTIATEVVDVLERVAIDREAKERLQEASAEIRRSSTEGTDRPLTAAEAQAVIAAQREFLRSESAIGALLEDFSPSDLYVRRYYLQRGTPDDPMPLGAPTAVRELKIDVPPFIETLVGKTGGMTALHHAARAGEAETAEILLEGGADIDQRSADGTSPLVLATLNGQFDIAMMLVERGANPNLATRTDGVSALIAVLQTQWANLYTDHPQPRAHDLQQTEYIDLLRALLEAGADPDMRLKTHLYNWEYGSGAGSKLGLDLTGATPFWRAAFAQDVEAMKLLVAYGADPMIPTAWPAPGMRGGRQQDGRLYEDSGLPVMPEGTPNMYPIHAASGGGYMGIGAFAVNNVPNNFVNAVKYLHEEQGVNINLPDSWGYTPLHYASARGGNALIEYLVSEGADVTAVTRLGQSTADMARGGQGGYFTRTAYPETVELLQSLGSPLLCLHTHFAGTGDYCPGSGVPPFEQAKEAQPTL